MIIGLDIGGTHTDVVLLGQDGIIKNVKVKTDQEDLFSSVLNALDKITESVSYSDIKRIVFSTTLTTNAIAQNKVSPIGMIVLGGPGLDPNYFKTNRHYFVISGSIDHRGREIESIDNDKILKTKTALELEKIKHIGVVSKFSVRNPSHEIKIRDKLKDSFDKIFLGHEVSGNLNFPRRIATTYLNASIYPLHKHFFEAVKGSLEKKGLKAPIHILKADGGTMNFESSIDFPAQTILSGPAASVMGAIPYAGDNEEVLVLDIGGTTTDMAILINNAPVLAPMGIEIGGYKTLIRALATQSIPLGGDSIVNVINGKITIGPDRMDSAMIYGGKYPTPTDAFSIMQKINNIDNQQAILGLAPIALELGLPIQDIALKIIEQACNEILAKAFEMIDKINSKPVYTVHELKEGHQIKIQKILVLGGPAPYFKEYLEKFSKIPVMVVPKWQVANAIGAALAKTTCEVTLFADTEIGKVTAVEENFSQNIRRDFNKSDAIDIATKLLKEKVVRQGDGSEDFETEILEELQFNMVRGFYSSGKNIRVKVQVKPGLIKGYKI
ncbi:MAG: hydantoinase/oxoprolinase family protein [Desulfobacterales bacterium]|nr:hydantoinase/oxoprolinase family protein [Desulfobacterales bacterium]